MTEKVVLYIHGKGGSYKEAQQYEKNCEGFDVIGLDYEVDFPWVVIDRIKEKYHQVQANHKHVYIIANSIGAFFTMLALQKSGVEKALFISPIVDMEKLITDMMKWANVTEDELQEQKEIQTDFGETLSWEYLTYVRNNPIQWDVHTEVLYGDRDNLTSMETIEEFVNKHDGNLTVMPNGEHWFHTEEQVDFLNRWMKNVFTSRQYNQSQNDSSDYIGRYYDIELSGWNDGVYDALIVGEDKDFIFYRKKAEGRYAYGLIGKKHIVSVDKAKEYVKAPVKVAFEGREFFCAKRVFIELAKEEGIIKGFFDFRDDAYRNVILDCFTDSSARLKFGKEIDIDSISKIEELNI